MSYYVKSKTEEEDSINKHKEKCNGQISVNVNSWQTLCDTQITLCVQLGHYIQYENISAYIWLSYHKEFNSFVWHNVMPTPMYFFVLQIFVYGLYLISYSKYTNGTPSIVCKAIENLVS